MSDSLASRVSNVEEHNSKPRNAVQFEIQLVKMDPWERGQKVPERLPAAGGGVVGEHRKNPDKSNIFDGRRRKANGS